MKKYFRIVLKGPHPVVFFDLEVAENVQLRNFWANIILAGCVVTENFCVAYDQIAHVSVVTVEQAQQGWRPTVVN
jgi:hypothetical protein